jgi:hypothetical protein
MTIKFNEEKIIQTVTDVIKASILETVEQQAKVRLKLELKIKENVGSQKRSSEN